MGTWNSIDGGLNDTWEYASLDIASDLSAGLRQVTERWTAHIADDSALTRAISSKPGSKPRAIRLQRRAVRRVQPVRIPAAE